MKKPKIYLAILNITSCVGYCSDAEHLYGHLILAERDILNEIEECNVNHVGEKIELFREISFLEAKKLDEKDKEKTYQIRWRLGEKLTNKFNTFDQVVETGIKKWKELNIDCPFISLYEGEKYYKNNYNDAETVFLENPNT